MNKVLCFLLLIAIFAPSSSFALQCSKEGYTVIFVNGIFNDYDQAFNNSKELQQKIGYSYGQESVVVRLGHNPSHFAGGGDLYKSAQQTLEKAAATVVQDYDLKTILMQIHPEVTTRKILLVGHSQGTFYTNAIYRYFLEHGMLEGSVAVYNLATPAAYVEGGGRYLTSENDKAIKEIRGYDAQVGARAPLPANINIPLPQGEENERWGGHHFSSSYLDGAPGRIIADIENALGKLKTEGTPPEDGCFVPPQQNLLYKAQDLAFKVGDPVSLAIKDGGAKVKDSAIAVTKTVSDGMANAVKLLKEALIKLLPPRGGLSGSQTAAAASLLPSISVPVVAKTNTPQTTKPAAPNPNPALAPKTPAPPAPPVAVPQTVAPPAPQQQPSPITPASISIAPGFGGGGGSSAPASTPPVSSPPASPVFVPLEIVSPIGGTTFATTSITFSGTTTPGFLVAGTDGTEATTTIADADGDWTLSFVLPEGENEVSFSADDGAGNMSGIATRTVTIDVTPPSAPVLSIAECENSFSSGICMIATTTVTLVWDAVPGAAFYSVGEVAGLDVSSTTATSQEMDSLSDRVEETLYINAYDALGNSVLSNAAIVLPFNLAVTINEIAWSGVGTFPEDEWIELSNNTDYAIDLTHFTLVSADSGLNIPLSGSIAAHGFYLIERRVEATDQPHDLIASFELLSDDGEQLLLMLEDGSELATFDLTPAVATCGGWCEGTGGVVGEGANSMQRVAGIFGAVGSDASQWQTYGSSAEHALGADGSILINGTPRAENSYDPPDDPPDLGGMN